MKPTSHQTPILPALPPQQAVLAQGFSEFIAASARLEVSYRELQATVTELRFALLHREQQLNHSLTEKSGMANLLRHIVEGMPCGVLVLNDQGNVLLMNPEAARLLALSAARLPDTPVLQDAATPNPLLGCQEEGDAGATDTEREVCFASSAGEHWIAVRRVHLPKELHFTGQSAGAVVTLQDISHRKRREQERGAARNAATLAQIAALLAHEVRDPLLYMETVAHRSTDTVERLEGKRSPARCTEALVRGASDTAADRIASLDQMERAHLQRTLERVGGNRTHAADMLGISVRTMRNKIRQYDLPPRRYA